ncbi:hypothetical protein MRX96_022954 [Rhipicephalus microplus]
MINETHFRIRRDAKAVEASNERQTNKMREKDMAAGLALTPLPRSTRIDGVWRCCLPSAAASLGASERWWHGTPVAAFGDVCQTTAATRPSEGSGERTKQEEKN